MIYFFQSTKGGPIKIGYTSDIEKRRISLEGHYGCHLALLRSMPGDRAKEGKIHKKFAHLRIGRTEQFLPAPDLMAFIRRPLLSVSNLEEVERMPARMNVIMDHDVICRAKCVAALRGVRFSEYVCQTLRRVVDEDFRGEAKRILDKRVAEGISDDGTDDLGEFEEGTDI